MLDNHEKVLKSSFIITKLKVEYSERPLGIDVEFPRFSWQMDTAKDKRGYYQTAYQIKVRNSNNEIVWDTGKTKSSHSLNIVYSGEPLEPCTKYDWIVTVWNQNEETVSKSSWFETGLMNDNSNLNAWEGAKWIGGSEKDLILYSHYLSVFKVRYTIQIEDGSDKASFILGANDNRLMDSTKNIYNVSNKFNESYIKFELDISNVERVNDGLANLNIFRVGYHPEDSSEKPFASIEVPSEIININNKNKEHNIYLWCNLGLFTIFIDGIEEQNKITKKYNPDAMPWDADTLNLNPIGSGNDYISFPMLADIGFQVNKGQKALFKNLKIYNYRLPSNVLFEESLDEENYTGIFSSYIHGENSKLKIEKNAFLLNGVEEDTFIVANPSRNSMPMLRTEFKAGKSEIDSARLYVTSRGIYEIYINGERVGQDYFNPGLTQYNKTHMYQTYDVTTQLNSGKNAIGVWLGEGWWSGAITFRGENWNFFGDRQSLLAKLVITYSDGSHKIITTNSEDWKYYNDGPLIYGSLFQGEVYDASKEYYITGWNKSGYDDSSWEKAVEVKLSENNAFIGDSIDFLDNVTEINYDNLSLTGQIGSTVKNIKVLKAQSVEEVRKGVYVYDMGQNMVGVPRIKVRNGVRGKRVTLRYAEIKYPDMHEYKSNTDMIMLENIRAALSQDIYICKGGQEIIQPKFTFHGFRFIEITGIDSPIPIEDVEGIVLSSMTEVVSNYQTSNKKVNRLWENIVWSQRGNFLSVPTDCPQRNERMGWSGDISVYSKTSTFIADSALFLNRHMYAMRDMQKSNGRFPDIAPLGGGFGGILWGSAGIIVPWEVYQQYDDKKLLEKHYHSMKNYINYLDSKIDDETGLIKEESLSLGDWLGPQNNKNEPVFLWSVYHAYNLWIISKVAEVLEEREDAITYWNKYEKSKTFFNSKFVDKQTHKTVQSDGVTPIDTQTSYAVPLALGVFNDENKKYAAEYLAKACKKENVDDENKLRPSYSLMTGFIGTASINKALSDNGYDEIAYRLLQQTSYPSWLYSVDQGATTIWERLNSYTIENGFGGNNSMNSFNHYSFGAVGAWMYNYSLGIQRYEEEPGFKRFILKPTPDPDGIMTWAKGYYDSLYGRIKSKWEIKGDIIKYKITVPANTSATLYLPIESDRDVIDINQYNSEMDGTKYIKQEDGKAIFEIKSGTYEFQVPKTGQ